ncbi:MAG: TM0106 family RecB-like putative nuclease [Chloroflexi bacterium]|nr:TM0106 family RecB-like putative nuclease [Chloroflexota bacterium]
MQRHADGTIVVSATDLVGFLECGHLTALELGRIDGRWEKPHQRQDPEVVLLQERGDAHEAAYLARLQGEGKSVHIGTKDGLTTPDRLRSAEADTIAAMRRGVDIVYQATLFDGRWRGHADFLLRVEGPSDLGSWHYEVADTKLARSVKGSALLQVCVYSDRLETVQGRRPERIHVVTGDSVTHTLRLDDFAAFYRAVKVRFEERVFGAGRAGAPPTYPDPVDHCRVCVWFPSCIQRRRDDDHPSIVAGMTRAATERLQEGGVPTRRLLAVLEPTVAVPDLNPRTLDRLRNQARIQVDGEDRRELLYELIEPTPAEPGRGLALLPDPSPLDLFFDIEADPWIENGGLEYLLGLVEVVGGGPVYHALWGHDRAGEKAAFESFIDLVIDRLARDPTMHVYHYAGYEAGAIKRLMQRHATRVDEVDRILRGGILVDLYNVVRQGIRASVESYSIKRIEKFYLPAREGPVTEAGFSVVAYETWLKDGEAQHLTDLADYNRDDCVSTWLLRGWLEERRGEAMARGWEMDRPVAQDGLPSESQTAHQAETARRVEELTRDVPADRATATPEQRNRWLLAQLLDWHGRDAKPEWWNYFRLQTLGVNDLIESSEAIGGLEFDRDLEERGRGGFVRRYRFTPQDHKIRVGRPAFDPADGERGKDAGDVVAVDDIAGTIELFRTASKLDRHPAALIPGTPIPTTFQRDALRRIADDVLERGFAPTDGPLRRQAARDLVGRATPRLSSLLGQPAIAPLRAADETALAAAVRLALDLDHGVLPIQGPPGTGKTWTGARMIAALVAAGKTVGVTAQSHKAITNLLDKTAEAFAETHQEFSAVQKSDGEAGSSKSGVRIVHDAAAVQPLLAAGAFPIAAGTAWLWSRPELDDSVDVLFVDEAGQLSLANALAVAGAARSLVLLGDPNQLPQVSQGIHPEGAGVSALEHLVGDALTVPPERGLLLPTSYRMHPDVNGYISEIFYERRLAPDGSTARQVLAGSPPIGGTGIRWQPVVHVGDESASIAEAELVADAIEALLGRECVDRHGRTRRLGLEDIVVVAPYNAHVAMIQASAIKRLGRTARVGTVDRFQGQEAPVAIYSMAASSADDAPRGMAFLYDGHRLNVAISRAMGLAIVIASPDLLLAAPHGPDEMRKANALCRLVEVAAEQAREAAAESEPAGAVRQLAPALAPGPGAEVEVLTLGLG